MLIRHQVFSYSPGIYMIKNVKTGMVYVGSSKLVRKRIKQHLSFLGGGKHHNHRLQEAWNLCKGADFVFGLVCSCETHELRDKETEIFKAFGLPNYKLGYNHEDTYPYHPGKKTSDAARAKMMEMRAAHPEWREKAKLKLREAFSINQDPVLIVSPDGTEVLTGTLRVDLARKIGVKPKAFYALLGGRIKHVKGWALPGTARADIYNPEGVKMSFVSSGLFKSWVNEPKIEIQKLLKGKLKSSRKWAIHPEFVGGVKYVKKLKSPATLKRPIALVNFNGETKVFESRSEAYRFLRADKADIYSLLRGKRKSIKGWRLEA